MRSNKQMTSGPEAQEEKGFDFGSAIAIGLSLGLVLGTALGNSAMGISTGLVLAGLANAYQEKKQGKKGANAALAITAGSLLFIILLWIATAAGWF